MPSYIKRRKQGYYLNWTIPADQRARFGGKSKLEDSLKTSDEKVARAKAQEIIGKLKLEALASDGNGAAIEALKRQAYHQAIEDVQSGRLRVTGAVQFLENDQAIEIDPIIAGVDEELDTIRERQWQRADPNDPYAGPISEPLEEARGDGLEDGRRLYLREEPKHEKTYEPPFRKTALDWLDEWKRAPGRKPSNTAGQYRSNIEAFADWWGDRPLRAITQRDAASYASHLTTVSAGSARHRKPGTAAAKSTGPGLAVATITRHAGTLGQVWDWAKPRLRLDGDNPWRGIAPRKPSRPPNEHLAWDPAELRHLLIENRPQRRDVYEACLVALFSGMRCGETADMTWGRVVQEGTVWCFVIEDAKTKAGVRRVPVHRELGWLLLRQRGAASEAIWPNFSREGPGSSRSGDLSKLFGTYKKSLGYSTGKTFHGFRKTELLPV